jgi:raffinose/stachyose/melibiose transport system substrate-binding protein
MADHAGVSIKIETMDAETLAKRVGGVEHSGEMPDLLDTPGGPSFDYLAQQGLLRDITADVDSWADPSRADIYGINLYSYSGKQFGAPWGMGVTGFYYNKAMFTKAGIAAPPQSWADFLTDVDALKAAGLVPLAIAGKDGWPAMNFWTYLMLREGGIDSLGQSIRNSSWDTDTCIRASTDLAALVSKSPFQAGYINATFDKGEAALLGTGHAAMELTGEWGPAAQQANSADGKGLGDNLGWFQFPTVDGGFGRPGDGIGSASGLAVGKNAPPQTMDFLHFLLGKQVMDEIGASQLGLPTVASSADSVPDPVLRQVVAGRGPGHSGQLYLNLVTTPTATKAIENAVAFLLAGRASAAQTCQSISAAAPTPQS